jgi:hypothetical protein
MRARPAPLWFRVSANTERCVGLAVRAYDGRGGRPAGSQGLRNYTQSQRRQSPEMTIVRLQVVDE